MNEPLRRSLDVKSLNFPHGLPQVLSRMARRSSGYMQTGVGRWATMANSAPRLPVELCLFLLAFCSELALRKHKGESLKVKSAAPPHD
ncbi:MAG TPA: hypothetical protein VNN81_01640 [Bradyrhizobium sp.]|nr:hypothetical protein [Bradyrhizobium sp.]